MNKTTLLLSALLYLTTQPIAPAQASSDPDDLNVAVTCSASSGFAKSQDYVDKFEDVFGSTLGKPDDNKNISFNDRDGPTIVDLSGTSKSNSNLFMLRFSRKKIDAYIKMTQDHKDDIASKNSADQKGYLKSLTYKHFLGSTAIVFNTYTTYGDLFADIGNHYAIGCDYLISASAAALTPQQ